MRYTEDYSSEKHKILPSMIQPVLFVLFIWLIKVYEKYIPWDVHVFAMLPRDWAHLPTILTFPLFHKNWQHLLSNSIPILLLGTLLRYLYASVYLRIFIILYLVHGLGLWIIGRPSYHLGASGLIYGLVTFHFFSGLIRLDKRSIGLSLLVTFLYGSMTWGILPLSVNEKISWEGHLSGAILGIILAFFFRKEPLSVPLHFYDQDNDDDDDDYGDEDQSWYFRHVP